MANQESLSSELSRQGGFISCIMNGNNNVPNITIKRGPGPNALPNNLDQDLNLPVMIAWMFAHFSHNQDYINPFMLNDQYGSVTIISRREVNGIIQETTTNVQIQFPVGLANALRDEVFDPVNILQVCQNLRPGYFEVLSNVMMCQNIYRIPQEILNNQPEDFDNDDYEGEDGENDLPYDLRVFYGVQFSRD